LSNPDTLYLHEVIKGEKSNQFRKDMVEEVEAQSRNWNWEVVHRSTLPKHVRVIPDVWAMKRKRKILDGTLYKWKYCLNVDGGKQIYGVDYWETYAPLASWSTIMLILMMAVRLKMIIRQLDFVQAFHQAPIEQEMYMEIPKGFIVGGSMENHFLRLIKNIYDQKQTGQIWNDYLIEGLVELGFKQSKNDMCIL
jgi:Reverse transcriptase (RNA-dependent DNA polymerase)